MSLRIAAVPQENVACAASRRLLDVDASVDGVTTGELRSKTAIASLRPVPSDFAFTAG